MEQERLRVRRSAKLPKIFKNKRLNKKIIKVSIITILLLSLLIRVLNSFAESFKNLCEIKASNMAKDQIDIAVSELISNKTISLEDLVTYTKPQEGTGAGILKSNVAKMNILAVEVSKKILENIERMGDSFVEIPLGSLSGIEVLSGYGPRIKVKIIPIGSVNTEFKTELISSGINQTAYRIYLKINCSVSIFVGKYVETATISDDISIGEIVIVGDVPTTYYNLEGVDKNSVPYMK